MGKLIRRLLIGAGVFLCLLIVTAVGVGIFFDVNKHKPEIEAAVNKATGLELKINGNASLKILPTVHVALEDVHFRNPKLSGQAADIFSAQEISVSPELAPFIFHQELKVDQVSLIGPKIQVEKSKSGQFNFETAKTAPQKPEKPGQKSTNAVAQQNAAPPANAQVRSVVVKGANLSYRDRASGQTITINDLNLHLSDIDWNGKQLSFKGNLQAQALETPSFAANDVQAEFRDDRGLIQVHSDELEAYSGKIAGNAEVDLRSASPKIKIDQTASHIDLAKASGKTQISGFADAKINLTAQGKDSATLTRTSNGEVAVRSKDITITGVDIDHLAGDLKTGQGLGLVNIGSSLMAGPMGSIGKDVAKGIGKAGTVATGASAATKSQIRDVVSVWKIVNGIAQAQDVAFATDKHIIAFKGDLDLVNKTYQHFYVATVDPKGCSQQKVEIEGPLSSPRPNAGSIGQQIGKSYLGSAGKSALSEGESIARMFGSKPPGAGGEAGNANPPAGKTAPESCDRFYQGSVIKTA